jgi:hypothetical protein
MCIVIDGEFYATISFAAIKLQSLTYYDACINLVNEMNRGEDTKFLNLENSIKQVKSIAQEWTHEK